MAKKKNKRIKNKKPASSNKGRASASETKKKTGGNRLIQGGLVAVVIAVGFLIWKSNQAETAFDKTSELGKAGLASVKTERNNGGGHYQFDHQANYSDRFPTSGQHNLRWVNPGFYEAPQNAGKLVHALEHGNVVIYYDKPGEKALALINEWTSLFVGQWSGVVAVPAPGLGEEVILSAWRKKLRLKPLVETTAAAFIDKFRGRGPEKPVR